MIRRRGFTMTAIGARQRASNEGTRSFKVQCSGFNVLNSFRALNFEPGTLELRFCSLLSDKRAQDHVHETKHNGAEESGPKARNDEARYEV
jgi:hypothetical protein